LLNTDDMKKTYILILNLLSLISMGQNQLFIGTGTSVTANSTITLSDADLTNNGTFNGAIKMNGSSIDVADTFIYNNNTMNVTIMDVEGNNAVNIENGDIRISNAINMNSNASALLLRSANIILESTAQINNESNTRRIIGVDDTHIMISKMHNSSAPETFGNIGFQIDMADTDLGNTEVYRRYKSLTIEGNESINRYYEINPENSSNINADVRFYYINSDLNGLVIASLSLYQSDDGSTNWTEFTSSVNDGAYPYLIGSGINPTNFWAIAESGIPLSNTDLVLSDVNIYPNPTASMVYLNIPISIILKECQLIDVNGRVINLKIQNKNILNFNELSEGMYFLKLYTDKGITTKKLVIKK
tara:strand:+ start:5967 stop:7046 length:1080 start_codon:yes stop_codon:yes gene_type:complete